MSDPVVMRILIDCHERWIAETPPTSQKARADRIAWSRLIYRWMPRGPERREARRRYRAEMKAFEKAHFAENPHRTLRTVLCTAPIGLAIGIGSALIIGSIR
jgi:hypothetical protein